MARLRHVLIALGCFALAVGGVPPPAAAQTSGPDPSPVRHGSLVRQAVAAAVAQAPAPPSGKERARRGAVRGALIGAGVGAAAAIAFAAEYGRNEGGGLCVGCLAMWGPAAAGAGAGIGAGVGAAIGAGTPSREHGVWPPPGARHAGRSGGAAIVFRF